MFTHPRNEVPKHTEVHFPITSLCFPHNMLPDINTHTLMQKLEVPHNNGTKLVCVFLCVSTPRNSPHMHIH